jgi:hypothetical protein
VIVGNLLVDVDRLGGDAVWSRKWIPEDAGKVCLRSEDAFVITCVANLMEVKILYVQQDLPYEISSYWRFNV